MPFNAAHLSLVLFFAGVAGCAPRPVATESPAPDPAAIQTRVVGYYFAPTVRRDFPVSEIDAARLTHVNYAFGNISPDGVAILGNPCLDVGDCALDQEDPNTEPGGNFAQLRKLKQGHPHLRTLISIGGWGWSEHFSDVAASAGARARFVASTLELFIRRYPGVFDGIDLDWEYPVGGGRPENRTRPEDKENYTALIGDFRRALDEQGLQDGIRYLLTIAAPAAPVQMENFEIRHLAEILDFVSVMTYDYHTGGGRAHFNAPLAAATNDPTPHLHVRATIDAYLAAGVPRHKLVLGVPFYGYGYGGIDADNHGLFDTAEGEGLEGGATGTRSPWVGSVRFHQIGQAIDEGFRRYWEPNARVPWLYNPATRTWITYDDAESIGIKADFAREQGLGGIMIWELSGDDGTLLPTIERRLRR